MHLSVFLFLLTYPLSVLCEVHSVKSLDFFYDTVNTESYTVVKYFTTWCSHCKHLGPVFDQLSNKFDNASMANITFLEVNCDLFGSTLCRRLPGYPVVELIKPLVIDEEVGISDLYNESRLPWYKRLINRVSQGGFNPAWTLDLSRVVEFKGNRNLDVLSNFIEQAIEKNAKDVLVEQIMSGKECNTEACEKGRKYLDNVKNVGAEIKKLQGILKSNPDEELEEIKFRLRLLQDQEDLNHDEL